MPGKKKVFEGKLFIKKGDTVIVIAGKDKGRTGEVTRSYPKAGKVVVAGINMVTKHEKAQPTAADPNPVGGRITVEAPMLACKLALVNKDGKPTRIRVEVRDGKRVRVAVKGGEVI